MAEEIDFSLKLEVKTLGCSRVLRFLQSITVYAGIPLWQKKIVDQNLTPWMNGFSIQWIRSPLIACYIDSANKTVFCVSHIGECGLCTCIIHSYDNWEASCIDFIQLLRYCCVRYICLTVLEGMPLFNLPMYIITNYTRLVTEFNSGIQDAFCSLTTTILMICKACLSRERLYRNLFGNASSLLKFALN